MKCFLVVQLSLACLCLTVMAEYDMEKLQQACDRRGQGTFIVPESDCKSFFYCDQDGKASYPQDCADTLWFDEATGNCSYVTKDTRCNEEAPTSRSDGEYLYNAAKDYRVKNDCQKYERKVNGDWTNGTCHESYFSIKSLTCVWPELLEEDQATFCQM